MLAVKAKSKLLNEKKAKGLDGITPKLLMICADQLREINTSILNWLLETYEVPILFRDSAIMLVPHKNNCFCLIDYRPVALISVAMKTSKSFVLTYLKSLLSATFDPLQFANCANRSSGDAIKFGYTKI